MNLLTLTLTNYLLLPWVGFDSSNVRMLTLRHCNRRLSCLISQNGKVNLIKTTSIEFGTLETNVCLSFFTMLTEQTTNAAHKFYKSNGDGESVVQKTTHPGCFDY